MKYKLNKEADKMSENSPQKAIILTGKQALLQQAKTLVQDFRLPHPPAPSPSIGYALPTNQRTGKSGLK